MPDRNVILAGSTCPYLRTGGASSSARYSVEPRVRADDSTICRPRDLSYSKCNRCGEGESVECSGTETASMGPVVTSRSESTKKGAKMGVRFLDVGFTNGLRRAAFDRDLRLPLAQGHGGRHAFRAGCRRSHSNISRLLYHSLSSCTGATRPLFRARWSFLAQTGQTLRSPAWHYADRITRGRCIGYPGAVLQTLFVRALSRVR